MEVGSSELLFGKTRSVSGSLGSEVTDAGGDSLTGISGLDFYSSKGAVALPVKRRIVEGILMPQFVGDFSVCLFQIAE